jgi:two-component system, cell cycle response regulator DivK
MSARIVLIEDNETNLDLMSFLLRAFGHETIESRSGEEGLALIAREAPDLVLCDLDLPGIDGYEVIQRLRAEKGLDRTPAIAVTAYAMAGDRERALRAGFDGYIPKPIFPETFVQQVEGFVTAGRRSSSARTTTRAMARQGD